MPAVILYGPPAAGKDTITQALTQLDGNYRLYQRFKVGTGRMNGYRRATLPQVDALQYAGDVIWQNRRYGALYVIDRPSLTNMLCICTPVLHLGQIEAVKAVTTAVPTTQWTIVWLWCPRGVALRRIAERHTGDTAARLRAWEETKPLPEADISINTAEVHPVDAAIRIQALAGTMTGAEH